MNAIDLFSLYDVFPVQTMFLFARAYARAENDISKELGPYGVDTWSVFRKENVQAEEVCTRVTEQTFPTSKQ